MSMLSEAFEGLYPGKEPRHNLSIKYSGKFNSYNANVRYTANEMMFSLSRQWKEVSKDIRIGLIQVLMQKALGGGEKTINMDLYNIFLKKVHISVPKDNVEPELAESFERVNEEYFNGMVEMPNLTYGQNSLRKLGSYEYGSDTIIISSALKGRTDLIDYVMHHEMLHKKLKYNVSRGRSYHHTREFRELERKYIDYDLMESKLKRFIARKKLFGFW